MSSSSGRLSWRRRCSGYPHSALLKAEKLSQEVEKRIKLIKPKVVSGPMVREITNNVLLEWSESENMPELQVYRNILTRVGVPVVDAYEIDTGSGFEAKENANLQPNPETVHKKKADRLSKEQYLLLMDPTLATAHHQGDIHIHTLEYFGSSSFLSGLGPRYFLYYGLIPDGSRASGAASLVRRSSPRLPSCTA